MFRRIQWICVLVSMIALHAMADVANGQQTGSQLKIVGTYQIEQGQRHGWLILNLEIPTGSHVYALTQEGNPPPTKIKLAESDNFELMRGFEANKAPHVEEQDPVFGQRVESHEGKVAFMAPIRVADGVDLENVVFDLKFHGQVCNDSGCIPVFNRPVEIDFAGFYEEEEKSGKEDNGQ
ncbi:MAG: protein-disulfide reductase DsbD domain-containing protein [Pirellulaceae bacterium]